MWHKLSGKQYGRMNQYLICAYLILGNSTLKMYPKVTIEQYSKMIVQESIAVCTLIL